MIARKSIVAVLAVALLGLFAAATSNAAVITIGSPLKGNFELTAGVFEPGVYFNKEVTAESKPVVSPVDGAVIRWRLSEGFIAKDLQLLVIRHEKGGLWEGPKSAAASPKGAPVTYSTALPIKKGQIIALRSSGGAAEFGLKMQAPALYEEISPSVISPLGFLEPSTVGTFNEELGFNADILPAPTVTGISPTDGPDAGDSKVTISGTDFAQVTKVDFGAVAAKSYKVESEGKIVATAPAGKAGQSVKVSVTTVAGTATAPKQFTYAAKKP